MRFQMTVSTSGLLRCLTAPALAHPPERSSDTQTTVECLDLASDAGTAAFIINVSETYGAWAQVGFLLSGRSFRPPE